MLKYPDHAPAAGDPAHGSNILNVSVINSVVMVKHEGLGTPGDAELLCHTMQEEVEAIAASGRRPAVFHDATGLMSASRAYATRFAECFSMLKTYDTVHVALVEKSYLRVLANIAMSISGVKVKLFKGREECVEYLRHLGYGLS
jgi:hypothetical protein